MKKIKSTKIFVVAMIIGFIWALPAFAWQDPCSVTENSYEYEGFVLGDWTPVAPLFSPAPECEGTVILLAPDGQWYSYAYIGNRGTITIGGILPCQVDNDGNLVCKVVTQPEESTLLIFDVKE